MRIFLHLIGDETSSYTTSGSSQAYALPSYVIERDYLLSWVLAGIGYVPELSGCLLFKGGTALKKCYFGDYCFSEDLDFSGLEDTPTGGEMEHLIGRVCQTASSLLEEYAPVAITCTRY